MAKTDEDYDWALGFEAATVPVESLPARPAEPMPPAPDAGDGEQKQYARALSEHAERMRGYDGDMAVLLSANANWSEVRTPLPDRETAEGQVKEFMAINATNPLVRNVGLYRTPTVKWERVELS